MSVTKKGLHRASYLTIMTTELTQQQILEVACKKLYRHNDYMDKIKEVMTIDDCLRNMSFWGAIYMVEDYFIKNIKKLRSIEK